MRYKNFFFIFLIISSVFWGIIDANALEIVELNPTMQKGETKDIELYVNAPSDTKEIKFSLTFLSYDVVGTFESSTGVLTNNGVSHTISYDEPITGRVKLGIVKIKVSTNVLIDTGTINLYNASATLVDDTTNKLNNQSIQVNITKEKKEEIKTNLLKTISSNIVNISLEPNKYEYELSVKNDIDKLDLTATAIDETYKVDITEQTLKEGKNQIFINVSKGDISEKYTINVTRDKKEEIKEEIKKNKEEVKKEQVSKIKNKNFKSGWTIIITGLIVVFIVGLSLLKKK